MKKLDIKSDNCLLEVNDYSLKVNNKELEELVKNNLPKLKNYKEYPVRLNLSIEFLGDEELQITPTGYEQVKEESEENTNE